MALLEVTGVRAPSAGRWRLIAPVMTAGTDHCVVIYCVWVVVTNHPPDTNLKPFESFEPKFAKIDALELNCSRQDAQATTVCWSVQARRHNNAGHPS